jgi:DNA-binding NtrC family response regulator
MLSSDVPYPDNTDLRSLLRFSTETGQIWLNEHRMLLVHSVAQGALRKELIESLGFERARGLLTRMGFASGVRDAELAKTLRPNASLMDVFVIGPQLAMLEGFVKVTAQKLEVDPATQKFYGSFSWENSWEAEEHLNEFGASAESVCWTLIGYASGFSSAFLDFHVIWKEVECVASGATRCRVIGKPAVEWEDRDELMKYYESDSIAEKLLTLQMQVDQLRSSIRQDHHADGEMMGQSKKFVAACELVRKASQSQVTVLLLGETGVGKGMFAKMLHRAGTKAEGPFVALNCAALPNDLVEAEMFGVEKGAYTGALHSRPGRFESAEGGTLFLDEVGELSLAAQAKLLHVLQEREIQRLGDVRTRKVNVRLIAATNTDLQQAVREGKFRADLFYRLNVYPVIIPPLRERRADIPLLTRHFVSKYSATHGKKIAGISDKALSAMQRYAWPGNIRELENLIERGVILAPQLGRIETDHLFLTDHQVTGGNEGVSVTGVLEPVKSPVPTEWEDLLAGDNFDLNRLEATLMDVAVRKSSGNLTAAANILGISRPQLAYRLKKLRNESLAGIS